ncbi:hypothetical protein [Goodfellowiella coeruleoviolacea]|uniref:DUF892 family protein n=1 Tax=Goodfellowiella coeruleoviolacea TaxID=334858 RepID=A0AAE3GFP0_9PSEU|nr:hypothetical protein [Goodfellowiella coeruleoviolacea]MCP2166469.1 hypothetical protein [Goodfellowiella coeruleoviolacea]
MYLNTCLRLLHDAEQRLAESFRQVARGHRAEADLAALADLLADQCCDHLAELAPLVRRYREQPTDEPERPPLAALSGVRSGPLGLVRDLQDLYLLASFVAITWTLLRQAGQTIHDAEILHAVDWCQAQTDEQLAWLRTRLAEAAPQALIAS